MRRFLLPFCAWLGIAAALPAQDQLDADIRMFTVMAAINAAGYDEGVGAGGDSLVRQAVRVHLEDFQGETRTLLENAYARPEGRRPGGEPFAMGVVCAAVRTAPNLRAQSEPAHRPAAGGAQTTSVLDDSRALLPRGRDRESCGANTSPPTLRSSTAIRPRWRPCCFAPAGYLRISNQSREFAGFRVWVDLLAGPGAVNMRLWGGNMQVVAHPAERIRPRRDPPRLPALHLLDPALDSLPQRRGAERSALRASLCSPQR